MGCAINFFRKVESTEQKTQLEKRFLILGLDGAGKTSILNRLASRDFSETIPTVGLNAEQIVYQNTSFAFWDVGGAATNLWKHYYQNTDAVIFVIDGTDRERMDLVKEELAGVLKDADLTECPLLIYANKQDKEGAISMDELSKILEFDKTEKKSKFLVPCSALKNEGLLPGLDKIVEVINRTTPKS